MSNEGLRRKKEYVAGNVFDFSSRNPKMEPSQKFKQVVVTSSITGDKPIFSCQVKNEDPVKSGA
jgi:hypothetical protein